MAISTEYVSAFAQEVSLSPEQWRPGTPEMQADVHAICEKWGISPPDFHEKVR
jgi:hypothetical protein